MPVFKSDAQLLDGSGRVIGEGRAYIHLASGAGEPQSVQGTLSLSQWDPDAPAPALLKLADQRTLTIQVDADRLNECLGSSRILRYKTTWPPVA